MIYRLGHDAPNLTREVNAAASELEDFYKKNAKTLFSQARSLGGVKLVTGGQRAFGPSALTGVRITGLYADTQLIPDPVYPYLTGKMLLNATHLQLAHALYFILQLRHSLTLASRFRQFWFFRASRWNLRLVTP